jgi:serine/threonine protein kinase
LEDTEANLISITLVKPGNLLCDPKNQRLRLIDFGSAADLDPSPASLSASNIFSGGKVRVGLDEGIVALSPVYAAPETFIKVEDNPTSFDVFSAALILCQLLFHLLDERTDAGFYQQLKDVEYNLDSWLEIQLKAKLRPVGLDDALEYLGERRGLWRVLKRMLQPDPLQRISSSEALGQFREVMGLKSGEVEWSDRESKSCFHHLTIM